MCSHWCAHVDIGVGKRVQKSHDIAHLDLTQRGRRAGRPVERRIGHIDIAAKCLRQVVITVNRAIGVRAD